jgi:hypothetical protein
MTYQLKLIGCSSPEEFFHRFEATHQQRKNYEPLFLAIHHSSFGELASSFGLFSKKGQLYTVHGTECSMWDFNGQFKPELTSIDLIEETTIKTEFGIIDGIDIFQTELLKYLQGLKKLNVFEHSKNNKTVQDYMDYIAAKPIAQLSEISRENLNLFKNNLSSYEDEGVQFYKFTVKTDWGSQINLFVNDKGEILAPQYGKEFINEKMPFIQKFISDLKGSIEIKENIFQEEVETKTQKHKF